MEPIRLLTIGLPKILQEIIVQSFITKGPIEVLGYFGGIDEYLESLTFKKLHGEIENEKKSGAEAISGSAKKKYANRMVDKNDVCEPEIILLLPEVLDECPQMIYTFPRAQIVSLENSGNFIVIWSLQPKKEILGQVTSNELAEHILSTTC